MCRHHKSVLLASWPPWVPCPRRSVAACQAMEEAAGLQMPAACVLLARGHREATPSPAYPVTSPTRAQWAPHVHRSATPSMHAPREPWCQSMGLPHQRSVSVCQALVPSHRRGPARCAPLATTAQASGGSHACLVPLAGQALQEQSRASVCLHHSLAQWGRLWIQLMSQCQQLTVTACLDLGLLVPRLKRAVQCANPAPTPQESECSHASPVHLDTPAQSVPSHLQPATRWSNAQEEPHQALRTRHQSESVLVYLGLAARLAFLVTPASGVRMIPSTRATTGTTARPVTPQPGHRQAHRNVTQLMMKALPIGQHLHPVSAGLSSHQQQPLLLS